MTPGQWVRAFSESWVELSGGRLTAQHLAEVAAERYEHDYDKDPADIARQDFFERAGVPQMTYCDNQLWWFKPFTPMPPGWRLKDGSWKKE